MNMRNDDEPRYVGTNWDDVKVTQNAACSARKVITKGTHSLDASELIEEIRDSLRQGFEVRLTDESGKDAIRIYPVVARGKQTMEPCIRAMNDMRECIADKKVRISEARMKAKAARKSKADGEGDEPQGVTPDTIITCENCGHKQRVGKRK